MKICVLGATGPSGLEVVREALERGHEITALVRNPDKLTDKHDKLKLVREVTPSCGKGILECKVLFVDGRAKCRIYSLNKAVDTTFCTPIIVLLSIMCGCPIGNGLLDRFKVIKVDIYDEDSMVEPMKGCDAVLSCLGCKPAWFSLWTITFYTDTIKPIVGAIRKAGVSRFIYMTAWYTIYDNSHGNFVNWVLKPIFLGESVKNMGLMENFMAENCSDLDHTAVRPPQLTNEPSEGKPVIAVEDYRVPGISKKICRRDVAKFMLDIAQNGEWKKTCVAVTSKID